MYQLGRPTKPHSGHGIRTMATLKEAELVEVIVDAGKSRKNLARPGYQANPGARGRPAYGRAAGGFTG